MYPITYLLPLASCFQKCSLRYFYELFLSRSVGTVPYAGNKIRKKLKVIYDNKVKFGYEETTDTLNLCRECKDTEYDFREKYNLFPELHDSLDIRIPALIVEMIKVVRSSVSKDWKNQPISNKNMHTAFRAMEKDYETEVYLRPFIRPYTQDNGESLVVIKPTLFRKK